MANTEERRTKAAAALQLFVKQYARKAQKRVEPNDRRHDRKLQERISRMSPEMLDAMLRDGEEDDEISLGTLGDGLAS